MDAATPACPRWEHFQHDADIGVCGLGPTLPQAFEQAALAMTAVMTDPERVRPRRSVTVRCEAPSADILLFDWLNALVFEMATCGLVFGAFEVSLDDGRLTAKASGEPVSRALHRPVVDIKGATLTELKVEQDAGGTWRVQCVVDV
ncbi:MAG: archease [Methyloligellaceae bacterium]